MHRKVFKDLLVFWGVEKKKTDGNKGNKLNVEKKSCDIFKPVNSCFCSRELQLCFLLRGFSEMALSASFVI